MVQLKQKKLLISVIGVAALIANSIVLYITFLWTYFANDYTFTAKINTIGEAHIEFILLPISIILGIYGVKNLFSKIPRENMKTKNTIS